MNRAEQKRQQELGAIYDRQVRKRRAEKDRELRAWARANPNRAVYKYMERDFKEATMFADYIGKIGWILLGVSILFYYAAPSVGFSISGGDKIPVFGLLGLVASVFLIVRYFGKYAAKLIKFIGSIVMAYFIFTAGGESWLFDIFKALAIGVAFLYAAEFLHSSMQNEYSLNFGNTQEDDDKAIGVKLAIYEEMQSKFGKKKARKMDIGAIYKAKIANPNRVNYSDDELV